MGNKLTTQAGALASPQEEAVLTEIRDHSTATREVVATSGTTELMRSKRHILPRNDIERIRRVVGMLRTKNLPFSSTLSILPQSAALRR